MKKILSLVLSIIFLFTSCIILTEDNAEAEFSKFVAAWFTYKEIEELCAQSNTEEEFINNINQILVELKKYNVNNLFLHARAFDDCFYSSSIFSVSEYCKNDVNELKFDVLKCFIQVAEKQNIAIHAWINPYRIRNDNQIEKIPLNSFAGKIIAENSKDERVIITENSTYYNPAYPEIQNYVLSGIREILDNYNVSGIHIDDYFYPTTSKEIDKTIYNDYVEKGGTLTIEDFRRSAVNSLISSIYSLVKSYNENICVSVSPSADIEKNYNNYYADVKLWSQNDGFADILIPQIYYGFNHSTMPFLEMLNEWLTLSNENTKIVIGLALYKIGNEDIYAENGKYEWIENNGVISKQIYTVDSTDAYGWSYFSSSYLYEFKNNNIESAKNDVLIQINDIW